jgi:uncharacterized membrane protein YidH (DUF202 family)
MSRVLIELLGAVVYLTVGIALARWITDMERRYSPGLYRDAHSRDSPVRKIGTTLGVVIWPLLILVFVFAALEAMRAEAAARKRGVRTNLDTWLGRIF